MRRWPRQWAPVNNEVHWLARYLVCQGRYTTEDDAIFQIVEIFDAYMSGKLRPADTATETQLLDGLDAAFDAAPEVMLLLSKIARGS